MSFHNILFPSCLEVFLLGKSVFSTSKVISSSGREIRSSDRNWCRNEYLLKNCYLSYAEFEIFNNFFKARGGSRFAFLLKDFADFKVQNQIIGTGNGINREFQLIKFYPDAIYPYVRKITKAKRTGFLLTVGDVPQQDFQLDEQTGIVTLATPPAQGVQAIATFEFYMTVRFREDEFNYELQPDGTIKILDVSLIEVLA